MRKYLIPQRGNFYKANLHTHSMLSDGKWDPAEIKNWYKTHGYSVVAITDHDLFIPHNDLTDDDFVALNGFELGMHTDKYGKVKCCHINLIAKNPFQNPPSYEKLVGDLQGYYSRRINLQHRLVYKVHEDINTVVIHSMWSHYGDN